MRFLKGLVILIILSLAVWLVKSQSPKLSEMSFDQLKVYFTTLAKQKGAKEAFALLKTAKLPPNTDLHLLGHVVGDELYKQEGLNGIRLCTEDFRNACSHSIVVGLFTDEGEAALPQISGACRQAPGGSGAYAMCFHGLGHGILAFENYDLEKAITVCQKTAGQAEIAQCISGTIMEIISGGGHDKALWGRQRQKYLFTKNPFYPCSADFMPEIGKQLCFNYLTPYLWEAVGADINKPTEADFAKSFALCKQIPQKDEQFISSCYGGFGKEFTTLAQNKDIRKIDQMSDEQFAKVDKWCELAQDVEGIKVCLEQALSSIFWGGENDRAASIRFCKVINNPQNQKNCFLNLIGQVSFYIKDAKYKQAFCQELPQEFSAECRKRLTCQSLGSKSEKLQCFEDLIDATLKSKDINQAFEIVEKLYQEDPIFVSNCHDFVHLIGEKTYKLFSDKKQFNLTSKTSYCGYGFYHAFMESLLSDDGDLTRAREFCDYAEEKLKGQNADAKGACYHGIGHGVADNHDQKFWANEDDLVDRPLTLCGKVAPNQILLNRCSSGVFNVLAIAYNGNKLKIKSQDPLWFCRTLKNNIYKKTCYEEMNTALFTLTKKDFILAASFLEAVEEDEIALSGIRSLAGVFGMSLVQNGDFEKFIEDCRRLQTRLRLTCIKGFAAGLIEGGSPAEEYEKALGFCKASSLNTDEKEACFEEALRLSSIYYPSQKHKLVCNLVDSKFRKYCP